MKIFLSIITLSFLLSGNVYSELIKTEDLMKENYRCKNIINQNEWTFSFSKISNKDYHVKASNNSAGKLFAKLTTPNDLVWYQIIEPEGDGSLIMNVLNYNFICSFDITTLYVTFSSLICTHFRFFRTTTCSPCCQSEVFICSVIEYIYSFSLDSDNRSEMCKCPCKERMNRTV